MRRFLPLATLVLLGIVLAGEAAANQNRDRIDVRRRPDQSILLLTGTALKDEAAILGSGVQRLVVDRVNGTMIAQGQAHAISRILDAARARTSEVLPPAGDTNEEFLAVARSILGLDPLESPGVGVMLTDSVGHPPQARAGADASGTSPAAAAAGTTLSDDFEGPLGSGSGGNWDIYVPTGSSQPYFWGKTTCDHLSGSYSADAVRGGPSGTALSCTVNHPNNVATWLQWKSTISVQGTTNPAMSFSFRGITSSAKDSQGSFLDSFGIYFSIDNNTGYGYSYFGDWSPSWYKTAQDMTTWYTLGDLRTYPALYVWFYFQGTSGAPAGYGFRIDDVSVTTAASGCQLSVANVDTSQCPIIKVTVTPTDASGQGIPNLGASNFSLTEDGQSRSLSVACGSQNLAPSNVTLVIDETGSLGTTGYTNEVNAAKSLVNLLPASTSIAVYFFTTTVNLLIDFTTDKNAVNAALTAHTYAGGSTAIYDALVTSSNHYAGRTGQRLTVLMTDGQDNSSSASKTTAISAATSNAVKVYTVGFGSELAGNTQVLQDIASQTGGQFYYGTDSTALASIVSKIGATISAQCTLTYTSSFTTGSHTAAINLSTGSCQASTSTSISRNCPAGSGCRLTAANPDTSKCPDVSISVTPTDSNGNPITGLGPGNFTLTEDGQSRTVSVSCGTQSSSASSVTLVIDETGSLGTTAYTNEVNAAKSLVNLLPANTSIAVYFFTTTVNLLIDFTTDKNAVNAALTAHTYAGGSTAIYDALVTSSNHYGGRAGQRLTVLMTDGSDNSSSATEASAIAAARSNGVTVYTVGFGAELAGNTQVLQDIASQTGGQFYYGTDSTALASIVSRIGATISSQCTITYTSGFCSGSHSVAITMNSQGCQATANATVSLNCCTASCAGPYFYFVPAGAHAPGLFGTQFVTDMGIFNAGTGSASVVLYLLERDADNSNPVSVSVSVAAGTSLELLDVFLVKFGRSSVSAALRICSNQPLRIMSRTYNNASTGTYGLGIPGYPASSAIGPSESGTIIFLYENALNRSNVGFVNTTTGAISITVDLYNAAGAFLGTRTYTLGPYGFMQRTQIFREVTSSDIANGRAVLRTNAGGFFGYATLIDNQSGDSTYISADR